MSEWHPIETLPYDLPVYLRSKKYGAVHGIHRLVRGERSVPVIHDAPFDGYLLGYENGRCLGIFFASWPDIEWQEAKRPSNEDLLRMSQ